MSDIVKKGFFRRCLYRATGAYLLEQHIQMLEQQVKTQQMQLAQMEKEGEERKAQDAQQQQFNTASQERLDHLELHAAAQDEHRNNIDAQLQQTAGQTNDLQRRMEWAEDGMREAGLLLPSELQLFNKKSYSQAGEDAILMYIFVMLGVPLSQCNYLDLGANHPCDMSNTWFFYQQGATGILVDANPKLAEELRRARPKDRSSTPVSVRFPAKRWTSMCSVPTGFRLREMFPRCSVPIRQCGCWKLFPCRPWRSTTSWNSWAVPRRS